MTKPSQTIDIILRNGTVFDGRGGEPFVADIAISGERITAIGDLADLTAHHVIDVTGKAVSPGFIDAHSHDDYACISMPEMTPKISQGVTSVVVGNCGLSLAPLSFETFSEEPFNLLGDETAFRFKRFSDYIQAVDAAAPAVNVIGLVGHTTLRRLCMTDLSQPASPEETRQMQSLLTEALEAGAAGLSTGVYYAPAYAADLAELTALAEIVGQYNGIYATHIRDEYDGIAEALKEAFETTWASATRLLISHHKCAGVSNWGRSVETLRLIDQAAKSQSVAMDCYPYTAGSSVLDAKLVDGEIDILINSSVPHPEMAGRYLKDIAQNWQMSETEAAERLTPGYACYFQIHEDDMRRILSHEACMVGSDGLPNDKNPHPRLWGTFPRVLGRYAREEKLFSMAQAVAKMTGLPAERFGLKDRGLISAGLFADITVFDPEQVIDRATFEQPVQLSAGIEEVFVNGVHSWSKKRCTETGAGRFLKRTSI